MYLADTCFKCGTAIVPKHNVVPMCAPCAITEIENWRQRQVWTKRLSAMGARPGPRTKRAARLRAVQESGPPVANDNPVPFGAERQRTT